MISLSKHRLCEPFDCLAGAQDKLPRKRKRGNPYLGAASGLPRRCAPRKDEGRKHGETSKIQLDIMNLYGYTRLHQPRPLQGRMLVGNRLGAQWKHRAPKLTASVESFG